MGNILKEVSTKDINIYLFIIYIFIYFIMRVRLICYNKNLFLFILQ